MAFPAEYADDRLGELLHALAWHTPIPPFARDWLLRSILVALRTGEALDQASGLAAAGQDSLQLRVLRRLRDQHLALAALAVAIDTEVSVWSRCKRLAPAIREFESRVWSQPAVRALSAPPQSWPEWKRQVFLARRIGLPVPTTAEGLYKRLDAIPPFCGSAAKATLLGHFIDPQCIASLSSDPSALPSRPRACGPSSSS